MALARQSTWTTSVNTTQYEDYGEPSDILGINGDRYWDLTNNIWYVKRNVGNLAGADTILFNDPKYLAPISNIEITFKSSPTISADAKADLFGSELVVKLRLSPSGSYGRAELLIGNASASAWVITAGSASPIILPNTWYKIRCETDDNTGIIRVFTNGELTYSVSGMNIGYPGPAFRFGSIDMLPSKTLISNCRFGDIFLPITEGQGSTISDPNGTFQAVLSDGAPATFWTSTWVPINMSYPVV